MTQTAIEMVKPSAIEIAGQVANAHAARGVFDDYRSRKAHNTLARQDNMLRLFGDYLKAAQAVPKGNLSSEPRAWHGMTWGLVEGFRRWLLRDGYAVGTVNGALVKVRVYAGLAAKAGTVRPDDNALIQAVAGYSRGEGLEVDKKRATTRRAIVKVRIGGKVRDVARTKKSAAVLLTSEQVKALKRQPDTPQGRRDAVLIGLLLDLGLRVGEVVGLRVGDVNLSERVGYVRVERPKVGHVGKDAERHKITNGLLKAMRRYFGSGDAPLASDAPLLRQSRKDGSLGDAGMTRESVMRRVRLLGEAVGVDGLSPHACRHTWATQAAKRSDPFALRDAGGWSSMAMPSLYVERAKIANERIVLEDDE